jgi:hypothetical protein
MKKLFLLLILSFFSAQGYAGSCPDGSEPIKSVSDDGTYFIFNCGVESNKTSTSINSSSLSSVSSGNIEKNFEVDSNSSHTLQYKDIRVDRQALKSDWHAAISYLDIDNDGDTDIFISAVSKENKNKESEVYLQNSLGNFILERGFISNSPGQVHPRKSIVGDYNGDSKNDIYLAGHGWDKPPYPGEPPVLILSSTNGYISSTLDEFSGFQHGAASADIDADGDLDIVVSDIESNRGVSMLLNDGLGNFTLASNKLREFNGLGGYYTVELVDVDEDGYVDLLLAGHEMDGANSTIFWGSGLGDYRYWNNKTDLPKVAGYGVIVDIDVGDIDSDGDKDIILNRTGSGKGQFYKSYQVQILKNNGNRSFTQSSLIIGEPEDYWFDWIRLFDINDDGSLDIVVDDASRNLVWINSGSGVFSKEPNSETSSHTLETKIEAQKIKTGYERWSDAAICSWLNARNGKHQGTLAEANNRGISCNDEGATKIPSLAEKSSRSSQTETSELIDHSKKIKQNKSIPASENNNVEDSEKMKHKTSSANDTNSSSSSSVLSTTKISNKNVSTLVKTTDPNALCSNGEQATYTVKLGSTNKWAVIMPGGGIAKNVEHYRNRPSGLKDNDELRKFDVGIEKDLNDRGYNMVWIPYCSNLAYQGNHDVMIDGKKVPFRGRAIVKDVIKALEDELRIADDIIFAGFSAGATGISFNADLIGQFDNSRVFLDSLWFDKETEAFYKKFARKTDPCPYFCSTLFRPTQGLMTSSTQGLSGSCPDGSEPVKSISADGTYFEYKCGSNINDSNTRDNSNRMDSCDADWTSCFPTRENFQKNGIDDVFLIWNIGDANFIPNQNNLMNSTKSDILFYNAGYSLRADIRNLVGFGKGGHVLAWKDETYKKKYYKMSLQDAANNWIDKNGDAIVIEY